MASMHVKAMAEFQPGSGFLVLSSHTERPIGSMASYDYWFVEDPPVTVDTELEALRLYYTLTREHRQVCIHPDPVPTNKTPRRYKLVLLDEP